MTDREKLDKIWNYITDRIADIELGEDEDYDLGMIIAFEDVLNFMDDLVY